MDEESAPEAEFEVDADANDDSSRPDEEQHVSKDSEEESEAAPPVKVPTPRVIKKRGPLVLEKTVKIAIILRLKQSKEQAKEFPATFRFQFLDKEGVTTPLIQEWRQLGEEHDFSAGDIFTDNEVASEDEGEKSEETPEGEEPVEQNVEPKIFEWKILYDLQVNKDVACSINENPNLVLVLSTSNNYFTEFLPLDISPLLDGDLSSRADWGDIFDSNVNHKTGVSRTGLEKYFKGLHFAVHTDSPILTEDLCEQLNPLSITLLTARPLPGVIVEKNNPRMQEYVKDDLGKSDAFALQKRYCKPVYATFEIFKKMKGYRVLRTLCLSQGDEKVNLKTKTSILLGIMERDDVAEYFETQLLQVALHDRDIDKSKQTPRNDQVRLFSDVEETKTESAKLEDEQEDETKEDEEAENDDGSFTLTKEQLEALTKQQRTWHKLINKQIPDTPRSDHSNVDAASNEGEEHMQSIKTLSVFDVDKIAWADIKSFMENESKEQTYGRASFRLGELCASYHDLIDRYRFNRGNDIEPFSSKRKAVQLDLRGSVVPIKRNILRGGDLEKSEIDITHAERVVREPGRYFESGTEIRIRTSVTHPIHLHKEGILKKVKAAQGDNVREYQREAVFERQIYMFLYDNAGLVQKLRNIISDINSSALPAGVSLRSHQLTEDQKLAAENGDLDIVTGFQVVDDQFRIIVIEGIGGKGMSRIRREIGRSSANSEQYKVLADPTIRFKRRLYTEFEVDLKVIRLRDPLFITMRSPEIYDRFKVQENCFLALLFLSEMRSANRLAIIARNDLFPLPEMLSNLESKYGESVSIEDMDGVEEVKKIRNTRRGGGQTPVPEVDGDITDSEGNEITPNNQLNHEKQKRRKAPTDSYNPDFLKYRDQREEKDYLSEQTKVRLEAEEQARLRRKERDIHDEELIREYRRINGDKPIFVRSGQRLNYVEWQKEMMRNRLARNTRATFTYSKDFQSLSFPLVNEERIAREESERAQKRFMTPSGFKYPAPRDSIECRRHPRELSQARIEELQSPWIENENRPKQLQRGAPDKDHPDFDCVPTHEYELFGGYHRDGRKNPDFFQSVHASGDGVERELKEKKKREEEEWRSKIIVDSIRLNPHYGIHTEKPSQVDKVQDILEGAPRKKGLRMVRNAKLPSGKRVPLRTNPVSIFKAENYL